MPQKSKNKKSALSVNPGVEQQPQISSDAVKRISRRGRTVLTGDDLFAGLHSGDRMLLGKAITLAESSLFADQETAQRLLVRCLPHSGNSIRIGVTGVPGAGKSTFIEAIGKFLTARGHKVAVLAIDPSSSRSRGSILGDKTRMEELASDENAFIRPSPSSGALGGVARCTWETIILCEAAGYDVVFVETVGTGQSETTVHSMVDFFLLLMLANAGDELQGIKRGITEMADALVITKADGDNIRKAQLAANIYRNSIAMFPRNESGWEVPVITCSAIERAGIGEVWDIITGYMKHTQGNGYFEQRRKHQSRERMYQTIEEKLRRDFYNSKKITTLLSELEQALAENRISAYVAAQKLLEAYLSGQGAG
jgi:LAO/AO transport system kinase